MMTTPYIKKISQNIKKYRLLHKMTQEQLASRLEVDVQYYAQLERGERNFNVDKIIRICSILNINIQDIIDITPEPHKNSSNQETIDRIIVQMQSLSTPQLLIVEKFLIDVIPFV